MKWFKMFEPNELGLTDEETQFLAMDCGGDDSNCYAHFYVEYSMELPANEDHESDYFKQAMFRYSINQKLIAAGCQDEEKVFIDCCW